LLFQNIVRHCRCASLLQQLRWDATEILRFLRLALEPCNKDATRRGRARGPLRLLLANATTPGVKARFDLLADEVADLDDAPVD